MYQDTRQRQVAPQNLNLVFNTLAEAQAAMQGVQAVIAMLIGSDFDVYWRSMPTLVTNADGTYGVQSRFAVAPAATPGAPRSIAVNGATFSEQFK